MYATSQMAGPRRERLQAAAHAHIQTHGVPAVIIDGNSTSVRDRCECTNEDMQQVGHMAYVIGKGDLYEPPLWIRRLHFKSRLICASLLMTSQFYNHVQNVDALLGPRDNDAVFYSKYCVGTPVRKDPEGRCQKCIDARRHPPADPAARRPAAVMQAMSDDGQGKVRISCEKVCMKICLNVTWQKR